MKCGHCGAVEPNVYRSDLYHPDFGFVREWSCMKCGSRDIQREEKDMAKKGTCENCGRPNMALFKATGTDEMFCATCRNVTTVYSPGPGRDKALAETKERLNRKLTLGAGNPPPSSPPPPASEELAKSREPFLGIVFSTDRDKALYGAILESAELARNENVANHVLHLLEKALSVSA